MQLLLFLSVFHLAFGAWTSFSDFSKDAFLEACHEGNLENMAMFINESGVTDQMILDCLKMQKDNKDAYLMVLSSERFVNIKGGRYPLYHGATIDKGFLELKMLKDLLEGNHRKVVKPILTNPYLLNAPNGPQLKIFRAGLHNTANKEIPVALSQFVDFCALHGHTNVIDMLKMRADITYNSRIPDEEAETTFFHSCQKGDLDIFVDLIVTGLIRDPSMAHDRCAKLTKSPEIMKALLHYPMTDVEEVLSLAVSKGRLEVVETILNHPNLYLSRQLIGQCKLLAFNHKLQEVYELLDEYMGLMVSSSSGSSTDYEAESQKRVFTNSTEDVEYAKSALKELISPADELIERFVVQPEPICFGSFGSVYRALDTKDKREVAIKHIDLYKQRDLSRISREISIMKGLSHPNLVQYIDSYLMGDQLWIVMELMSADAHCLKWKLMNEQAIAAIAKQLLSGLAYLHASNIIHRDVKPENILYNDAGIFKLADFGLSIKLQPGNPLAGSYVGTTEFLAPEMVHSKFYNNKIDIWSLGVTLFEMATGKTLYTRTEMEVFMRYIVDHQVVIPDNLGEDFRDFLAKCLAVKAKDRPSAQELLSHPFLANAVDLDLRPILPKTLEPVSYDNIDRAGDSGSRSSSGSKYSASDDFAHEARSALSDYLETGVNKHYLGSSDSEESEEYGVAPGNFKHAVDEDEELMIQQLVDRINSYFPGGRLTKPVHGGAFREEAEMVQGKTSREEAEGQRGRSRSRRPKRQDGPNPIYTFDPEPQ